ncbi:beta-lactamase/transpeptidase-like protein [Exidia glandulosa HHB12029]|uniref:Beta-lactamase/transpeptidase-like protein n=1 Tax=Exidia glandulosa HHB12029 TaxID=1314781 RepID=A0A165KJI0_EXIGL|nr:beta-lactamase/transpeptidase-like protein [Exidia glandulosa HHB12029]
MPGTDDYYQPLPTDESGARPVAWRFGALKSALLAGILAGTAFCAGRLSAPSTPVSPAPPLPDDLACRPFLPDLFAANPPSASHQGIAEASSSFRAYLDAEFAKRDMDGLSVAVVTSEGPVFEGNWGLQRANESATSPPIISASQYRVASVSKLLLTYEAWILAQRGVFAWDDRVDKYLPTFQVNYTSFAPYPVEHPPITLHQLATHLSGIGRDIPAGVSGFPLDLSGNGPPPENGRPFPSHEDTLEAIRLSPLISPPGTTPAYSNTAFGLLGMTLVAANRARNGDGEPDTIAALMQRDVFAPLGMKGTHYLATSENSGLVVVPSEDTEIIDMDFLDAMNPSGGMFTSLEDIITFIPTLLDASKGPLTRATLDRWLRPVHSFAEDDWTELGVCWEIFKHADSHGRRRRLYMKLGELGVTHAAVGVHPGSGYGVVVLMSGTYSDAAALAYAAYDAFQPAFDAALEERAARLYSGVWQSQNGTSHAHINVHGGTLWLDSYVLNGAEVNLRLFGSKTLPLRSTGRHDELRLDAGSRSRNGQKHAGCMARWGSLDDYGMRNGAAVTLIYFTGGNDLQKRELQVPAAGVHMRRVSL